MRHTGWYILENKIPKRVPTLEASQWLENNPDKIVKHTNIGSTLISTVFLGLDHQYGDGEPLLFETMIFENPLYEDYQERYSTWEEAEAGHKRAVELIEK